MRTALLLILMAAGCGDDAAPPGGNDASTGFDSAVADARPPGPDTSTMDATPPDPDTGTGTDAGDGLDGGAGDGGAGDAGTAGDAGNLTDAGILGTDCTDDTDCAPVGFCRDKMGGGRECVPYSAEGESCGGFTPPWGATRCEPGLSCIDRSPLIADAPGLCGLTATVAEILADPAMYDGHVVGILSGWILGGLSACTRIGCSPAMPCCNTCNGGENLHDVDDSATPGIQLRDDMSVPFTCTGTECNPTETCTVEAGFEYRVIGTYHAAGNYIDVLTASRTGFP